MSTKNETGITFVKEWLDSLAVAYEEDVKYNKSSSSVAIVIHPIRIGIFAPNWKKPISIKVLNSAVRAYETLGLSKIYILADNVSHYVQETIERIEFPVYIIDSYSLSIIFQELQCIKMEPVPT